MARDERSAVEKAVDRAMVDTETAGYGKPLTRRQRQTRRSVEQYLAAGMLPRYMERAREIDQGVRRETARLERAYRKLQESCAGDAKAFARRWRATARSWRFDKLNELIRQHNEWYPVEAQLPMDPRTRDYVQVGGRSFRRPELGASWVLERFPAKRD